MSGDVLITGRNSGDGLRRISPAKYDDGPSTASAGDSCAVQTVGRSLRTHKVDDSLRAT